jgi:hypothetical protein
MKLVAALADLLGELVPDDSCQPHTDVLQHNTAWI